MAKIVPSQVVEAIDVMFGTGRNELDGQAVRHVHAAEIHTLLALLDDVPGHLVDLALRDYLELNRCRAVLATALAGWRSGGSAPAAGVSGRDPVERIRRLMRQCRDEPPPAQPELPFIDDPDVRMGIEDRIAAAWIDFEAQEWLGSTVLAAAALEALLLWGLRTRPPSERSRRSLESLALADLIDLAARGGLIDGNTEKQASLARDARNLIHPGKALRSGQSCNKATALMALAAAYAVIDRFCAVFDTSKDAPHR
jgi:hypothetical protein